MLGKGTPWFLWDGLFIFTLIVLLGILIDCFDSLCRTSFCASPKALLDWERPNSRSWTMYFSRFRCFSTGDSLQLTALLSRMVFRRVKALSSNSLSLGVCDNEERPDEACQLAIFGLLIRRQSELRERGKEERGQE